MSTIPRRASRSQSWPANKNQAGHFSGLHPEDQPYISADLVHVEDESSRRPHTSIRTYQNTRGEPVIERGNQRIIVHQAPPPKRRYHWSVLIGIGMVITVLLFLSLSALATWWTNWQQASAYGYPRTFQMDVAVGHHDSQTHPSHFIFLNLEGHVLIIEFPGGDATHARIYSGPTLVEDGADKVPVTASFQDVTGDGKLDMVVHIGDKDLVYLNDGSQFKPQQ